MAIVALRLKFVGICTAMVITAGCGGNSTEPSPSNLATCPSPNYPVTTLRWASFPIRVYIEDPELVRRGYSNARIAVMGQLIMQGLGSWSSASSGQIGGVTRVQDSSTSQLNVVFRNGRGDTIHDGTSGNTITHATVLWDVDRWEAFGSPYTNSFNGVSFTDGADHRMINGMAHEMGHVLGIVEHPTTPGSLMIADPTQLFHEAPQPIDINSIRKKYGLCS